MSVSTTLNVVTMSFDGCGGASGRFALNGHVYEFTAHRVRRFRILQCWANADEQEVVVEGETTRDDGALKHWVPTDDELQWHDDCSFGLTIEIEDPSQPSGWRRMKGYPHIPTSATA